eukprot:403331206
MPSEYHNSQVFKGTRNSSQNSRKSQSPLKGKEYKKMFTQIQNPGFESQNIFNNSVSNSALKKTNNRYLNSNTMILKQEKPSQNQVQFSKKQEKIEQVPYYAINNNCSSAKANESSQELEYSNQTSHTVFNINSLAQSFAIPRQGEIQNKEVSTKLIKQQSSRVSHRDGTPSSLQKKQKTLSNSSRLGQKQIREGNSSAKKNIGQGLNHKSYSENFETVNFQTVATNINSSSNNMQQIYHKQKMKNVNNFNDSISEDVSMDHINESPSVKNLDDQNPKLLDHIKETLTLRLPNQIESCEITIDELEQRIRNSMEVFNSRQNDDEEDLGDIQQEDIEENHPKQAHKNLQMIDANSNEKTKDLHNHLSNYSSIASGKAQFTPHKKSFYKKGANVLAKLFNMLKVLKVPKNLKYQTKTQRLKQMKQLLYSKRPLIRTIQVINVVHIAKTSLPKNRNTSQNS